MKLKPITGVGKIPRTIYFIDVEGGRVEVEEPMYEKVMSSLANGDVWIYSVQENKVIKYGTQLNLF